MTANMCKFPVLRELHDTCIREATGLQGGDIFIQHRVIAMV